MSASRSGPVERATLGQRVVRGLQRVDLVAERLVELRLAGGLVEPLLDRLEVGEGELDLDDAEVLDRVARARHVVVLERPQHEHDGVDLADVGEELVAEALALARAFDEAADVDDLDRGVDHVASTCDIAASRSSRSSGTLATPMLGSFVANGYGAASAPPPVRALYSELLPALGRPTRPKRSIAKCEATGARFPLGPCARAVDLA